MERSEHNYILIIKNICIIKEIVYNLLNIIIEKYEEEVKMYRDMKPIVELVEDRTGYITSRFLADWHGEVGKLYLHE